MKKLLILLLGLMLTVNLHAQSDEVTLVSNARLLFAERLLLELAIPLPASQVTSTTLSIAVPGRPLVTIDYPTDQPYRFANEFVVADYDYAFPALATVTLFTEVQVRWTVLLANGERLVASDSVVYEDTRVTWQTLADEDNNITFTYGSGIQANLRAELRETVALVSRLRSETGTAPTVRWLFYPQVSLCETDADNEPIYRYLWENRAQQAPCDPDVAARVITNSGYQFSSNVDAQGFFATLRRDLVESTYDALWEAASVPQWFREGLIGLYVRRRVDDVGLARLALRTSRPLSLTQMQNYPTDPALTSAWYAQAHTQMRYLLDTFGVAPVFELARSLSEEASFEASYESVLGQPLSRLLAGWESWLLTDAAYLANNYSIYSLTTPTPTPTTTPSATPVPATPSDTPTPEPTRTTAPPVTRTRIPPTATLTPLPPQSFVVRATPTVTPIPPPPSLPTPQTQPVFFAGMGAALLGLVLLAGVILLRRRS